MNRTGMLVELTTKFFLTDVHFNMHDVDNFTRIIIFRDKENEDDFEEPSLTFLESELAVSYREMTAYVDFDDITSIEVTSSHIKVCNEKKTKVEVFF